MSKTKNAQIRYKVIDRCLNNPGREYTFSDLKQEVDRVLVELNPQYNGISEHQLRMDIRFMISSAGYDAPIIKMTRGRKRIYTYESSFSLSSVPMNETELKSLDQAISILRMFEGRPELEWLNQLNPLIESRYVKQVKPIISFESNLDYKGYELIPILFNTILNEQVIDFDYIPFNKPTKKVTFHPHFLKQFTGRWYIFGKHHHQNKDVWHLPLDRIENVSINTEILYLPNKQDWEEYFYDIIGIIRNDETPQEVTLSVNAETMPYIQTKPLHPTQRMKKMENGNYEIRIQVIPNHDLISLLLSYGQDIVVLSPSSLKYKLQSIIEKMSANYID